MGLNRSLAEIDEFLGSAHVFACAVHDAVDQRLLDEVAGGQITVSQVKLLKLVAATDSYSLGDVASFLDVSNAAASKSVDRLVRRNLLLRSEDQKDRRTMHLTLGPAGRRLLSAYESARRRKLESIFTQFSREDLQRTAELLDRISAGIVDHAMASEELCLKCGIYFRERCLIRQLVRPNCFYQRHKPEIEQRNREE
jgi:DNA-binding MarR family transcriptional regulator